MNGMVIAILATNISVFVVFFVCLKLWKAQLTLEKSIGNANRNISGFYDNHLDILELFKNSNKAHTEMFNLLEDRIDTVFKATQKVCDVQMKMIKANHEYIEKVNGVLADLNNTLSVVIEELDIEDKVDVKIEKKTIN